MELKPIVKGLLTFVPGLHRLVYRRGTGGTDTPSYCYEVWLKHLTLVWENKLRAIPNSVAELGPGDSLGVGLAALLSGACKYYALDVVPFANRARNLQIFDGLVELFKQRAARPSRGWPDYDVHLDDQLFPSHILTSEILNESLREDRLRLIRSILMDPARSNDEISIKYVVPWFDPSVVEEASIDMVVSHAVLEHVVDLETTYRALRLWLKDGGVMSHQIDFASHGLTEKWNGHWACPDGLWKLVVGKRPFLINRQPCSTHVSLHQHNGFEIACQLKNYRSDGIARSQLSSRWKGLSDDDFVCAEAFIQASKV